LHDIAERGQTRFPQFAYMPHTPNKADSSIADGAVVALEDGFPLKETLTLTDLVAAMQDVRAIEDSAAF
jgi:hypothetical protein